MPLAIDDQATLLYELLLRCTQEPRSEELELVKVHLQGARMYLLSAAHDEYKFSLHLARSAIQMIGDRRIRSELDRALLQLTDAFHRQPS